MRNAPRGFDNGLMKPLRFPRQPAASASRTGVEAKGSFGRRVLEEFAHGAPLRTLDFRELERVTSRAGSIIIGAAAAGCLLGDAGPVGFDAPGEAATLARRTADGFRAALQDRRHTVLAWPWEHLGTRLAWCAAREDGGRESLGPALDAIAAEYAARYPKQLAAVLDLWDRIASGLATERGTSFAPLREMGRTMFEALAPAPARAD